MKKKLIIALLLATAGTYAQCVECTSFAEAEKDPAKVISLKKSPYTEDYEDDELEEVPASLKLFVNIEKLYLTDLSLGEIPATIGNLKKLKELGLAGNSLTEIPEEIYTLTNLKELILYDNEFSDEYIVEIKRKVKEKLPKTKLMID
jgi:hypothetical protein